jgi:hypothetical protein
MMIGVCFSCGYTCRERGEGRGERGEGRGERKKEKKNTVCEFREEEGFRKTPIQHTHNSTTAPHTHTPLPWSSLPGLLSLLTCVAVEVSRLFCATSRASMAWLRSPSAVASAVLALFSALLALATSLLYLENKKERKRRREKERRDS